MKKYMKNAAVLSAAAVIVAALSGCSGRLPSSVEDYKETQVASYGETKIYLDEVNLMLRLEQYEYEPMYKAYMGEDVWTQEMVEGYTMEDSIKEAVMSQVMQTYVLNEHAAEYNVSLSEEDQAKVDEATAQIMENMTGKLLEATGATEELVRSVVEKNALANRVYEAVIAQANTEVSDEEAAQVTAEFILVAEPEEEETETSGEGSTETTEAETAAEETTAAETETAAVDPEVTANEILERAQSGESMADIATDLGLTRAENSYGKNDDTLTGVGAEIIKMATDEYKVVTIDGVGSYAVHCITDFDEEKTAEEKQSIIEERRDETFSEVYSGWEKQEFEVVEGVWNAVSMADVPVTETTEAQTESSTEAAETTAETTESSAEAAESSAEASN